MAVVASTSASTATHHTTPAPSTAPAQAPAPAPPRPTHHPAPTIAPPPPPNQNHLHHHQHHQRPQVQISGDLLSNAGQCSSGARRRLCWAHAQSALWGGTGGPASSLPRAAIVPTPTRGMHYASARCWLEVQATGKETTHCLAVFTHRAASARRCAHQRTEG